MIRYALALAATAAPFAVPPAVSAASDLSVLPQGRYECWTSGAATGPPLNVDPERSFTIVRGSSYASEASGGTYLLASDVLTFTRGPFKDARFRRNKEGYWQQIASDGALQRLKCNRTGPALLSEPDEGPDATVPDPSGPDRD